MPTENIEVAPTTSAPAKTLSTWDFTITGRYKNMTMELSRDIQRHLGVDIRVAVAAAKNVMAEYGRHESNPTLKAGKVTTKKSGEVSMTVREAGKVKFTYLNNPLKLLRAIAWLNEAKDNFVSLGKVELDYELKDWVENLTPAITTKEEETGMES